MDLLASKGLALHECSVEPALARLAFGDGRGGAQETFLRLGLVREWLKGSVADWLRQQRPGDVEVLSEEHSERDGHAVAAAVGVRKPALFRRGGAYVAAAWECPKDRRLYCVSLSGASAQEPAKLAGRRLSCCEAIADPGAGITGWGAASGDRARRNAECGVRNAESPNSERSSPTLGTPRSAFHTQLAARPVRNVAAQAAEGPAGGFSIAVATRRPRWLVPPLSWLVPHKPHRTVRLDNLGGEVWALCDGERPVEAIVDEFAARHGLSFHEARVAVTGYLSQLVQRGVLAVAIPTERPGG